MEMMRCSIIYIISIILAMIGFACQSSSNKNSTQVITRSLRLNIQDDPQSLDPRKVRSLNGVTLTQMLFEGLTRINREETSELALAESVRISSDLKTYTFTLKSTVWSNGDPLTASDFVYAWKKVLSPDFPSDMAFQLYPIKNAKRIKEGVVPATELGVDALDERTLVIELEHPTPYFLELLSFPTFYPINQKVEESNPSWAYNGKTFVGNGPFQIVEWKHQDILSFVKNKQYWDAAHVALNAIEFLMLKEETEFKMFEKQELDWAGSPLSTLPSDVLETVKQSGQLKTKELLGTFFIRTNTTRPPFNHPACRKAFAFAINRQAIVDHVTQGNQLPATGLVPLSFRLQKHPYFVDADLTKARELLEEGLAALGMKKENLPEISLTYRSSERSHLIAQVIQQQWLEAFGIQIKLIPLEGKVYIDKISKLDFDLSTGDWHADFKDPINFLDVFRYKTGGSNNTQWENPRYATLLDKSSHTLDLQERMAIFAEAEQILIDEMPIMPIFHYTMLYMNQPYVKDVIVSSMGRIDLRWAFIERSQDKVIAKGEK